jgi:hypothetical protein
VTEKLQFTDVTIYAVCTTNIDKSACSRDEISLREADIPSRRGSTQYGFSKKVKYIIRVFL